MKNVVAVWILLMACTVNLFAQDSRESDQDKSSIYIGYDFGEMAFNKFQNFAGEVGLKFKNEHTLRFVYLNVKLTEEHLSSDFAQAVDGENVTGLWKGMDLIYDIPIYRLKKTSGLFYGGLTFGYHDNFYEHTILEESMDHKTATLGFDIGFRETNIFKIKGLYMNLQIPVRYNLNKLEETKLGDTTINKSVFSQTISFFVGYEF